MAALTTLNITEKNANNTLPCQKKMWIRFILMGSNYLQTD